MVGWGPPFIHYSISLFHGTKGTHSQQIDQITYCSFDAIYELLFCSANINLIPPIEEVIWWHLPYLIQYFILLIAVVILNSDLSSLSISFSLSLSLSVSLCLCVCVSVSFKPEYKVDWSCATFQSTKIRNRIVAEIRETLCLTSWIESC